VWRDSDDPLITAAARALAAGDPLGALNRVALRDDAPALALRGIAMARLGDLVRIRWRRSVLLRRRKQREGENRPPTQARFRGRQRLRDPRRLHEQVTEAALTGQVRRSLARRARATRSATTERP
jgi:hypothetical protein